MTYVNICKNTKHGCLEQSRRSNSVYFFKQSINTSDSCLNPYLCLNSEKVKGVLRPAVTLTFKMGKLFDMRIMETLRGGL